MWRLILTKEKFERDVNSFFRGFFRIICSFKPSRKTTVQELTQLLSAEAKQEIEEDFVLIALDDLYKASLLENGIDKIDFKGLSRRNILMRYALPTLVFPAVLSLVSPTPAQTGSCLSSGQTDCCVTPCCPGLFCGNALGIACPGVCLPIID